MDAPAQFHFSCQRLVEFADTDLAGIVHFANFFTFVESAEHAFFRSLGFRAHTHDATGHHGWPRIEVSCKYIKPARFEQTLEIGLRIEEIRSSSLRYQFWILSTDDGLRSLLASGAFTIIHVAIDTDSRTIQKAPIPADLRAKLEAAMAKTTNSH